jgi:hypothetical protein
MKHLWLALACVVMVGCGDHSSCLLAELNGLDIDKLAQSQKTTNNAIIKTDKRTMDILSQQQKILELYTSNKEAIVFLAKEIGRLQGRIEVLEEEAQ